MQPNNIWFTLLDADLPTPTKSVGMTLMKRAAPNTNQVNLSMPDFLTLTGCGNEQAAKRHLIRLKQAGFIHYSTCSEGNLNVFITFLMEETGTQITQMNADLELGALHFPKCVAPHDGDTSESDGTQDARHSPVPRIKVHPENLRHLRNLRINPLLPFPKFHLKNKIERSSC